MAVARLRVKTGEAVIFALAAIVHSLDGFKFGSW
jgi:hypothetical protein